MTSRFTRGASRCASFSFKTHAVRHGACDHCQPVIARKCHWDLRTSNEYNATSMNIHSHVFTVRQRVLCNARYCKAFLSVLLSARLSNACFVTKRKKLVPTFLYHTKDHSSWFSDSKDGCGGDPLYTIFGQIDPVGTKTPIFNQYSLVAPQP